MRLAPTIDVEYSSVQFLGNLHLHLWDCGGQDDFYKNYLDNMRDHIFRSVGTLCSARTPARPSGRLDSQLPGMTCYSPRWSSSSTYLTSKATP